MDELLRLPASALAERLGRREVSASDAVEACLARIAEVNPRLNAVVSLAAERAREEARAADAAAAEGRPLGPLHGVPVTVKDAIDVAGLPATSVCLRQ